MNLSSYLKNRYHGNLGVYEITQHIASGGMGHVFQARCGGRDVIAKFPSTHMPDGQLQSPGYHSEVVKKLKIESHILKNFTNENPPHIVKYIDESTRTDEFFLILEKIQGKTLGKIVSSGGIPQTELVRFSTDVLQALEFMHKHNTIYRDMKPENIMVTSNKRCVLIDFGGAKQGMIHASPGQNANNPTMLQTPGWTCPEQELGKASAECDLYAFGKVMFFMATGIKPQRFSSSTGRMKKNLRQLSPSINTELSNLVDDLIDPGHNTIHTANDVLVRLNSMVPAGHPVQSQHLRSSPRVNVQSRNTAVESRIVLQGVEYMISNKIGGSIIGKIHDQVECTRLGGDCNMYSQGRNIFVGWTCPNGCKCSYNPAHVVGFHQMRIWRDHQNQTCVISNDPTKNPALNRNGRWMYIRPLQKIILQNRDQVALLYDKIRGPFMSFVYYER